MSQEILDVAITAARRGGEVLQRYFGSADLDVRRKAASDFVTRADQESEAAVVETLLAAFPDHRVVGEEGGSRGGDSRFSWWVDPLDGTTNFLQGVPVFCVSVACLEGEQPLAGVVLDPTRDDLFSASRGNGAFRNGRPMRVSDRPGLDDAFLATGYPFRARAAIDAYLGAFRDAFLSARAIRRCGAAALDLAYTAAGIYDGFFEFRLSPWDLAAGTLLVEEAGGVVTDLNGGAAYLHSGNVIAGTPGVQPELLATVLRHADEAEVARLTPGVQSLEVSA